MEQTSPEATVIIPLWNGKRDIEACLESVYRQNDVDFDVIIVDNASSDGSPEIVAQRFPQARLIRNASNLGFSGGVNVGLRAARGDVMVLLNQDTEVKPDWLTSLVDATHHPLSGVVGSKAFYPDGTIQHAGGKVSDRGEGSHIGQREIDDGRWDQVLDCDFVTGASMAITRAAYDAVGGFDEEFAPAYYEDVDYCYRVREAGFTVRYVPDSTLIHKEASRAFSIDLMGLYAIHKNRLRFILKQWLVDEFDNRFMPAEAAWVEEMWNVDGYSALNKLYHDYVASLYANNNLLSGHYEPYSDSWTIYVKGLSALAVRAELRLSNFTAYVNTQSDWNRTLFAASPVESAHRPELAFISTGSKLQKQVLVINPNFPPKGYLGGAEISSYHTSKGLLSRGMDVHVLSINAREKQDTDAHYAYDGIPVHRVAFTTARRNVANDIYDARVYRAVRREIERLKPDIVHIHNASGASLAPFVATERENIPTVCTLHDLWLLCPNNMLYKSDGSFCYPSRKEDTCKDCFRQFEFWGNVPKRRQVYRYLTRNVRAFMTPSQMLMHRHIEAGYDPGRFAPLRLGFAETLPVPVIHPEVAKLLTEDRKPVPTLLFTGGGILIKGAEVFAQALKPLIANIPDLRVIVVGSGSPNYYNMLRALGPMVIALGKVPFTDMRHLMSLADLVLLPSVCHENSPVTIFEAYQVGTPVVGSDFGGLPENIDEGKTGYTFPVRRYDIMTKRIIDHFSKPESERRKMRANCLRKVRTELSLDQHLDATLAVYRRVLGL